jgi:hypothetical protein
MSAPTFPTIVTRQGKGSALLDSELDSNFTNIRAYCLTLANIIASALNQDGTIVANSVSSKALQAAAVTLASLNPALLYSLVPVDTDIGTVTNAYAITAQGGLGGSNLVTGSPVYDSNGNYVLSGLTLNYGYYWTRTNSASDDSVIADASQTLSASGAFVATKTSITLTGTPGATVTATVVQSAPISAYKEGQVFFVYTANSNTGAATLNVNNLGAIPIKLQGASINAGVITGPCVFAVVYKGGSFILFSGAASNSGSSSGGGNNSTVIQTTGYSGISQFTIPNQVLAASYPTTVVIPHGLGSVPTQLMPTLYCLTGNVGFLAGQSVELSEVKSNSGGPAFSWAADASNIYITQLSAPYLFNPSNNSLTALTTANWNISGSASVLSNFSGVAAFPALEYQVANPMGAFSYGGYLYTFSQAFANSNKYYVNQLNMLNNEIIPLTQQASTVGLSNVNGALFGSSFNIGGINQPPVFLFASGGGIFYMFATNPNTSMISGGTAYNSSGTAQTLSLTSGAVYTWTPGTNDISLVFGGSTYPAANAVNGQIVFTAGSTGVATLNGAAGTAVTGTLVLVSSATSWVPNSFSTKLTSGNYKPVWYNASDSLTSTQTVYLVGSDYGIGSPGGTVSSVACYQVTSAASKSNGTWATTNTANLDLANSSISNVAAFNAFYPSGSTARVLMFQYNPLTKRIYVITNELAVVHIFKITASSNDFSAWWNSVTANREGQLQYIKSVAIGGAVGPISTWGQSHYAIEYNLATGKEVCIVQTRDGGGSASSTPGSVTRIPWNE